MTNPYVSIPADGYHFARGQIRVIEEKYGAKYIGYWCTKRPDGCWNERPVDVFYQPNPDTEKGHSHYFGMFVQDHKIYITNAESAFCEPIVGVVCDDGEVIVSRYRHDYVTKGDRMIDGGRDYTRRSIHPTAEIAVSGGEFVVKEHVG